MKATVSCKSGIMVYYSAKCIIHNPYIELSYKLVVKELSFPMRLLDKYQKRVSMRDKDLVCNQLYHTNEKLGFTTQSTVSYKSKIRV